jgi:SNF2 family DNA or RNA helicase
MSNVNRITWSLAILDEVHRLKNLEAKSTQCFMREFQTRIKIGLTGTMLQNNYIDVSSYAHAV